MRIFSTVLCALAAVPAILALPSLGSSDLSSSLFARGEFEAIYANSTLEARSRGNRDHCRKSFGRKNDDCSCYAGLGCGNAFDKCECGDRGNARFDFCSSCNNDEPKCLCNGDHQHYNKREQKCFCDEGFDTNYSEDGVLSCTKPSCGDNQHFNKRENECACNDGFYETTKNGKLFCKPIPTCGPHLHFDKTQVKCVCDDKYQLVKGSNPPACEPCKPTCGEHQHVNSDNKCECDSGFNAGWKFGHLVCVPCPTTTSKTYHPRSLETAAPKPVEFRTVEDALGCSAVQTACKIGSAWTCFDSSSNLASCGGCPGEGADCSSINKVDEVRCEKGQCVIGSCLKGYAIDEAAGTCVARGKFWSNLLVQGKK